MACWATLEDVQEFLANHSLSGSQGYDQLLEELMRVSLNTLERLGKTPVVWGELSDIISNSGVLMPWKCWNEPPNWDCLPQVHVNEGHDVVLSRCGPKGFYLDADLDWQTMYQNVVLFRSNEMGGACPELGPRRHFLLGAEVCLWSERVDAERFHCRAWPRMATMAEKLWSFDSYDMRSPAATEEAFARLRLFTERIRHGFGVDAAPLETYSDSGKCERLSKANSTKHFRDWVH